MCEAPTGHHSCPVLRSLHVCYSKLEKQRCYGVHPLPSSCLLNQKRATPNRSRWVWIQAVPSLVRLLLIKTDTSFIFLKWRCAITSLKPLKSAQPRRRIALTEKRATAPRAAGNPPTPPKPEGFLP